jgi:hypothetical protein
MTPIIRQTEKAAKELEKAWGELNFWPDQWGGRRGTFSSVSTGISFGGGQQVCSPLPLILAVIDNNIQVPGNLALANQTLRLFQRLFALACFFESLALLMVSNSSLPPSPCPR